MRKFDVGDNLFLLIMFAICALIAYGDRLKALVHP